jgi:hypothetical protein
MRTSLLSPQEIQSKGINEKNHIIYYTFLRPKENCLDSLIKENEGITLSRSFEGLCSPEEFESLISKFVKEQTIVKGLLNSTNHLGENKDIPVLTIKSKDIIKLHKKMMTALLFAGSPYIGDFLYKGHHDIKAKNNSYKLIENKYNPHITLNKFYKNTNIAKIIGREFSCEGIYSRVKRFGKWDEIVKYRSFLK